MVNGQYGQSDLPTPAATHFRRPLLLFTEATARTSALALEHCPSIYSEHVNVINCESGSCDPGLEQHEVTSFTSHVDIKSVFALPADVWPSVPIVGSPRLCIAYRGYSSLCRRDSAAVTYVRSISSDMESDARHTTPFACDKSIPASGAIRGLEI